MFTDNILQYQYSSIESENNVKIIRRNPFLDDNDSKVSLNASIRSDFSQISIDNSLVVSDHFDRPLAQYNHTCSVEELTYAIHQCKERIFELIGNREAKEKLIIRLIELNESLHIAKEEKMSVALSQSLNIEHTSSRSLTMAGHTLIKSRRGHGVLRLCEVCQGSVRTPRIVYCCNQCLVNVHDRVKCLQGLQRVCPGFNDQHISMLPSQIISSRQFSSADNNNCHIDIDSYPLTGNLMAQKFLCAECNRPVRAVSPTDLGTVKRSPTKFCHYYRKFYCDSCHWDNRYLIPAVYFMFNKWRPMPVCRSAYIYLSYMWHKTLFRTPIFWEKNHIGVGKVLIIRRKLFSLRGFIIKCTTLKKISANSPEWLIDQPYLVTMNFVEDICSGAALETVQVLYSKIVAHIPQCEACQPLCDHCHICNDPETLYVMSGTVWTCCHCFGACIHEHCALTQYRDKSEYICRNCSKT